MSKRLVLLSVVIGIFLVLIAGIYFLEPAKSLPVFFPGHDGMLSKHHYRHGIGALALALGCFAFAWFQSGKKSVIEQK